MKTIFILENRRTIRRMVEISLQHLPVQLSFFDQSTEVEYGSHAHLILCDEVLHEGDYQHVLIALRQKQIYAPALILCNQKTQVEVSAELTIVDRITKPFLTQNLVEKVCQVLGIDIPDTAVFKDPTRRIPLKNGGYFEIGLGTVANINEASVPINKAPVPINKAPIPTNAHHSTELSQSISTNPLPAAKEKHELTTPQATSSSIKSENNTRTQFGFFALKNVQGALDGHQETPVPIASFERVEPGIKDNPTSSDLNGSDLNGSDLNGSDLNGSDLNGSDPIISYDTSNILTSAQKSPTESITQSSKYDDSSPEPKTSFGYASPQTTSEVVEDTSDENTDAQTSFGYVPPDVSASIEENLFEAKTSFGYVPPIISNTEDLNIKQVTEATLDTSTHSFEAKTSFGYVPPQPSPIEANLDIDLIDADTNPLDIIIGLTDQVSPVEDLIAKTSFGYVEIRDDASSTNHDTLSQSIDMSDSTKSSTSNEISHSSSSDTEAKSQDDFDAKTSFGYVAAKIKNVPPPPPTNPSPNADTHTLDDSSDDERNAVQENQPTQVPSVISHYSDYEMKEEVEDLLHKGYEHSMPPPIPEPEALDLNTVADIQHTPPIEDVVSSISHQAPNIKRESSIPPIVSADLAFASDIPIAKLAVDSVDSGVPADIAFASDEILPQAPKVPSDITFNLESSSQMVLDTNNHTSDSFAQSNNDHGVLRPTIESILNQSAHTLLIQMTQVLAQKLPYADMTEENLQNLIMRSIWDVLPEMAEKVLRTEIQKTLQNINKPS